MDFDYSRRKFLKQSGAATLSAWSLLTLGGCETLIQRIQNRPTRRNINGLASNDPIIVAYKDAVSAMMALPASDPRNWEKQALIHYNFCPHGNWFFLPWHRAYLYYFESICRQLSGYADFALPYWDWTCNRSVPSHFWGSGNPLNHARTATSSSTLPDSAVGQSVMNSIMALSDFQLFGSGSAPSLRPGFANYGELEGTPHNFVHGWTGGDMGTYMSPRDPVFWCHHNMIEYCWVEWNIGRNNANPNDSAWSGLSLGGMFCDKDGNPVNNITVATTLLMPLLSYQFDNEFLNCASGMGSLSARRKDTEELRRFLREGAPSEIKPISSIKLRKRASLPVGERVSNVLNMPKDTARMLAMTDKNVRLLLTAKEINFKGDSDVFVRVFINKADANANTPISDPHYAGAFAFFALDHKADMGHEMGSINYVIDVTDTLERLAKARGLSYSEDISVQLIAVPMRDRADRQLELSVGGFDLDVSEVR